MKMKAEFLDSISKINKNYDINIISKAYDKAKMLHEGQLRKSGEPYLMHPVAVTVILAELGMDENTLIAGLLHDAVEDTDYTREELIKDFGNEIEILVDGVTKLGAIKYESKEELQAENLRKMFLAMSVDIRVLIIKLADRLHNMLTLEHMKPEKRIEKAKETLEIYAPLASRLGIYTLKFELEDLALKYLHPEEYAQLVLDVEEKREQRLKVINVVIEEIKESLDDMNIANDISGRSKHLFSVYKKMKIQNKQIDEIFDLTAIRILVTSLKDCYAALGIVHTMWKPIPGRFKDYIAMPKSNMYQSLHTTVFSDSGEPFEIQIRTYEMHNIAEYGIAAHWKYKEGDKKGTQNNDDMKLAWLRQTLEWQKDLNDSKEFVETLKMDLFSSQVYVFTPQGDVIELPAGSTPLDFAFKIHSAIGCKCVGAKVNGKMVTIDHTLENGNIVEIVTSSNAAGPSVDWLRIAKSSAARNKIRQWLKKENKSDTIDKGKDALDKYIRKKGCDPQVYLKNQYLTKAVKAMNIPTLEEFYMQIYNGGPLLAKFYNLVSSYVSEDDTTEKKKDELKMLEFQKKDSKQKEKEDRIKRENPGIIVKGVDNLMVRVSKCCNPVPGDEIVGFTTKGRGVSVHRKDCTNVISLPEREIQRLIEVEWEDLKVGKYYNADVCIIGEDRRGMFSDISRTCEDLDVHISGMNAKSGKDGSVNITLTLEISSTQQMQKVLRILRNVQGVSNVYRAKS